VSKENMTPLIEKKIDKILEDKDNYKLAGTVLDKEKVKKETIKEVRKLVKIDTYDSDIKKIEKRIHREANEVNIDLMEENKGLKDNIKKLETKLEKEVENLSKEFKEEQTQTLQNHNTYIDSLNTKHKIELNELEVENQKLYNNNEYLTKNISKLENVIDKLNNKYNRFKNKIKSIFKRNISLNNGLKSNISSLMGRNNDLVEKINNYSYDMKLIQNHDKDLLPKLREEEEKRMNDLLMREEQEFEGLLPFTPTIDEEFTPHKVYDDTETKPKEKSHYSNYGYEQ
jgi:DNA repair exonuclease SbcCD ATPase subunit